MMVITSPLEQFQILPVIPFHIGSFDFSITNSTIIILIGLSSFCFLLNALINSTGSYNLVPNRSHKYRLDNIWSLLMKKHNWFCLNPNIGLQIDSYSDLINDKRNIIY